MSFGAFFAMLVTLLVIAPKQFAALGQQILTGLIPIAQQGLVLAITVAALFAVVGKLK